MGYKGFSYMGRQLRIVVGSQEFFPDLLFYNTHIHAYVVIELKAQTFKPEFLGQLSFYVSAVNNQMKTEADNPTIGLLTHIKNRLALLNTSSLN